MNGKFKLIVMICGLIVGLGLPRASLAAVAKAPNDDMITDWVMAAIAEDPRIISEDIMVTVKNGVATLFGQADNIAERRYADLEAKKVKGVRGVINQVKVKRVMRDDDDLRQLVSGRIRNSSAVPAEKIGVMVHDGEVALSGTVASYVEKQEASLLASEVRGVVAVHNQMQVELLTLRPDSEIKADLQNRFRLDVYLVDEPIVVEVTDGVATLGGSVASPYLKDRALIETYQVRNVTDVHNEIEVEWGSANESRNHEATPSDMDLTHAVETLLALDQRIDHPWRIHVKAELGHVTLSGSAATFQQARLAVHDTKDVVGVAWVSNKIEVHPVPRSDHEILQEARFNIDTDVTLLGDLIKVFVHDGTVSLTGTVHTYFQKVQAVNDVARIVGVADVENNLDVSPHPGMANADLKAKLVKRLAADWATWPVLGEIAVTTDEGRVTLSGLVDNWQQHDEAARITMLTAGVLTVDNHLSVKGAAYDWEKWYGAKSHDFVYDPYFNSNLYLNLGPDKSPLP